MRRSVILAPHGFPCCAVLTGLATLAVAMLILLNLFGMASVGGAFVVSALIGIGAFAARLG
ncbi:hypothetical protein [Magnetospirillum sp. UT-4]|uniref:hypothetical protein n=1 Tax=Magnetospirillum sp. UT-4 TaxID=2681467 RepID=UPI001381C45A|nr:hypothetical protein [Magnetospirillum sp. UT-4]CAA7617756.1 conserved exported hypothetical protein [Magnetospirillum sp. UT-4]